MITALGIDPGLRATGYSVIQGDRHGCRIRELGVIQSTSPDLFQRLRLTYQNIAAILHEHRPELVVLEDLFAHQTFPRTALDLAHMRGVISLAAALADIPVETLTSAAGRDAAGDPGPGGGSGVIAYIRGRIPRPTEKKVVVEAEGVGYEVHLPAV